MSLQKWFDPFFFWIRNIGHFNSAFPILYVLVTLVQANLDPLPWHCSMILITCYPDWITKGCETELNNECDRVMKEKCVLTSKLTLLSLLREPFLYLCVWQVSRPIVRTFSLDRPCQTYVNRSIIRMFSVSWSVESKVSRSLTVVIDAKIERN